MKRAILPNMELDTMLDILTPLGTISEFSIGIAGFAGIVAAINRPAAHNRQLLSFRFTNLLVTAFAPGFFAIVAISLIYSGFAESKVIYAGSAGLLVYLLAWAGYVIKVAPRESVSRIMTTFLWLSSLINMLVQITNLINPSINLIGFFLFGLVLLLLQAAFVFAALALSTLKQSN